MTARSRFGAGVIAMAAAVAPADPLPRRCDADAIAGPIPGCLAVDGSRPRPADSSIWIIAACNARPEPVLLEGWARARSDGAVARG